MMTIIAPAAHSVGPRASHGPHGTPVTRRMVGGAMTATTYIDHMMMMMIMLLRQSLSLMMTSVVTRYIYILFFSNYITFELWSAFTV